MGYIESNKNLRTLVGQIPINSRLLARRAGLKRRSPPQAATFATRLTQLVGQARVGELVEPIC
jgi:hypothetical protein